LLSKDVAKIVEKFGEKIAPYFDMRSVDGSGHTVVHYAVCGNAPKALKAIIDIDAKDKKKDKPLMDIGDLQDITPLALAASQRLSTKEKKDIECLQILIDAKADPKLTDKVRGWTPLHFAASSNNVEGVEYFLKKVDAEVVNFQSIHHKQTPLMVATFRGNMDVFHLLLKDGKANRYIKDTWSNSIIHEAVKQKKLDAVIVLLFEHSPKDEPLNQENGVGITPLDVAMLTMTQIFHDDRNQTADSGGYRHHYGGHRHHRSGKSIGESLRGIYQNLQGTQGSKRVLVKAEDVSHCGSVIMDVANGKIPATTTDQLQIPIHLDKTN